MSEKLQQPGQLVMSTEGIRAMKAALKKFNNKYKTEFSSWWSSKSIAERETFIRDVYPPIVQSLDDRYCLLGDAYTTKTYEGRYDQYLAVLPEFTVEYMASGSNFPDAITAWTETENALNLQLSDRALTMRRLCKSNDYSWPSSEFKEKVLRQLNVKKHDRANIIDINSDEMFGAKSFEILDPVTFLNGSGDTPSPIEKGRTMNLFTMGVFILPYEFEAVKEAIFVFLHLLSVLVDEYKDDVMDSNCTTSVARAVMGCQKCLKIDSQCNNSLRKCSSCLSVWYCSKECQKADWKAHKGLCHFIKSRGEETVVVQEGSEDTAINEAESTTTGSSPVSTTTKQNEK